MQDLVCSSGLAAVAGQHDRAAAIERRAVAIYQLGQAAAAFAVEVRMEDMTREDAEALVRLLRIARYLEEATSLLPQLHATGLDGHRLTHEATKASVLDLLAAAQTCLTVCGEDGSNPQWGDRVESADEAFEARYQEAKATVLRAAATHLLSIDHTDRLLDAMSSTRRMIDQTVKATLMLLEEVESRRDSRLPETATKADRAAVGVKDAPPPAG
jgi:hypothetical protein